METTIYHGGNILTCDGHRGRATAMAVADGRIVAIGQADAVRGQVAERAQLVDLAGATVLPDLIDVHNHHELAGRSMLFELVFGPDLDVDAILARVRTACETAPAGKWVVGEAFGSHLLERIDTLDALKLLDDASLGRPVVLRDDSHHNRWCNTAAMAAASIDATSEVSGQGHISVDPATGRPTGLLTENATRLIDTMVEEVNYADPALHRQAAAHAIGILNSHGITAFQDAQTFHGMLTALSELDRDGALTAWVVASLPMHVFMYLPGPVGTDLFRIREQFRSKHVRPDFAKFVLDGVPTTQTALMLEPYRASRAFGCCYFGSASLTLPQFARMLAETERAGLAAKMHCTGDGSLRMALDAIDIVRDFDGPRDLRHQIAHAVFLGPGDIERMARHRVTADMSPVLWYPGIIEQAIRSVVADDVVDRMAPIRDLIDAGILVAGGTDWPVSPSPDLWDGIEGMVTRSNPRGGFDGQLGADQAIDVHTALQAYTLNGAAAMGLEGEVGSLEAGKSADFIIVDRDPTAIDPHDIGETTIHSTWFEGRQVYAR